MNTRILLFGSPHLGSLLFDALSAAGYPIVGMVTQKEHPFAENQLALRGRVREISIFTPETKRELAMLKGTFARRHPNLIAIGAYGLILPKSILDLPTHGGLNIHFSALPKYRGPIPVRYAIWKGDSHIAISIVKLTPEIDNGPIIAQHWEPIRPDDTGDSLYNRLCPLAADLFVTILPDYLTGKIQGKPQATKGISYAAHLTRDHGKIDLENPSTDLKRRIRAFHSFPGVWSEISLSGTIKRLKFLPENFVQLEGKRPVPLSTFMQAYPATVPKLRKVLPVLAAPPDVSTASDTSYRP